MLAAVDSLLQGHGTCYCHSLPEDLVSKPHTLLAAGPFRTCFEAGFRDSSYLHALEKASTPILICRGSGADGPSPHLEFSPRWREYCLHHSASQLLSLMSLA